MGGKLVRITLLVSMSIFLLGSVSMGQEADDSKRAEIFKNVGELTEKYDFMRAVAFVQGLGDPLEVSGAYENLVLDFYWKGRSVSNVIGFARSGLQFCLTEADRIKQEDPEKATALKTSARRISYNLASFTWPGWDEKDLILTPDDIAIGLDAARLNIRLVDELNEGEVAHSIAYWSLGAQLMAVQKYDEAIEAFEKSKQYARDGGEKLNVLLADGYIGITMVISGKEAGRDQLGEAIKKLNEIGSDDALFFVEQFNTVLNVFVK